MAKALKVVAEVVGVVALVATGIGAAAGAGIGLGLSTATLATIATVAQVAGVVAATASIAATALSRPGVSQSGNQDKFTASLDQGVPIAFGRTAVAGFIVHRQTWDWAGSTPPNAFQTFYGVWSGAGPIKGIEAFQVNSATVGFTGDITHGEAAVATGSYNDGRNNGWMWLQARLGQTPEPTALRATGFYPYPAGWSASAKLSGYAAFAWTLKFDAKGSTYPGGVVPQPRAVLNGVLAWDPRHDDTYPGGAGPQRRDDPTTWGFTENPFVLALQWARGWWQNGKRVMGIGMALAAIDVPSAVYAANIADANSWKAGGVAYSTDGKWEVIKKLCMAGSGEPLQLGGTLSFLVDAPRVSLATITDDDIIGRSTVPGAPRMVDRINGCIPTYREETQDWQLVPATKVTIADYVAIDGKPRSKAITWELVQQVGQVAQLAAYAICNSREIDGVVLPLKLRWIGYKPGDALTVASSTVGMENQLVVVRKRHLDPATAAVTITARTETTGKHAFALGQTTTPPPSPALQAVDLSQLIQPGLDASWSRITDDNGQLAALRAQAATAAADAQAALGDLARIGSDGWLNSGSDKRQAVQDWQAADHEVQPLLAQANQLGVDTSAYVAAKQALDVYLNSLSPRWYDQSQDTAISPPTWNGKWTDYYFAKVALLNAISAKAAQTATWDGVTGTGKDQLVAQAAAAAANAQTALGDLARIGSDGWLNAGSEKRQAIQDWTAINDEIAPLHAQAGALGVSTATLDAAKIALDAYLNSLSPRWSDTTQDTAISAASWNGRWTDYYFAKVALEDAMAQASAQSTTTVNRIRFSGFEGGQAGWSAPIYNPAVLVIHDVRVDTYQSLAYLGMRAEATAAGQIVSLGVRSDDRAFWFSVTPGETLSIGAGFQTYGPCAVQTCNIFYYAGDGTQISHAGGATRSGSHGYGDRLWFKDVVPAGAVLARVEWYATSSAAGVLDIALSQPMVCAVSPAQSVEPAWVRGTNSFDGADVTGQNTALDALHLGGRPAGDLIADVDKIGSDGALTPPEKQVLIRDWNDLTQTCAALVAKANSLQVAQTEATNANNAVNALASFLNAIVGGWNDTSRSSPVNGGGLTSTWNAATTAVAALNAAINGQPGKDGQNGVSPSPAYPAISLAGAGTYPYPNPVPLNPGQTVTALASINASVTNNPASVTLQTQYSLDGGSSWTVFGTDEQDVSQGEPGLCYVRNQYTNGSSALQILNIRAIVSSSGSVYYRNGIMQLS